MKRTLIFFSLLLCASSLAADIKLSNLPLGAAVSTGGADSFPFVSSSTNVTKRMTVWDISNVPTVVQTYAPKANAIFTGTTMAASFIGPLTGNASTATALAANPTDCSSGQYANAIAASGNLTCSAVSTGQLSGTLAVTSGGTGLSSTTTNQLLYSSATNTISGLASANTGALVTSSSGIPSIVTGAANRVLHSDGTTVSFTQVVDADVSSIAAITRSKLATGTASHVIINDGGGVLSSEATLAKVRGGMAQDNSSLTFPSTGTIPAITPAAHGVLISGSGAATNVTGTGSSTQVLTSNGASADPTFQALSSIAGPRSEVWVYTATGTGGVGSTNTAIRRFATTGKNTGSSITYADSSTNGASFTINSTAVYSMTHCFQFTGGTVGGISLNSSQLTTSIDSITAADRLISAFTSGANAGNCVSLTSILTSGDVIRPHITVGAGVGGTTVEDSFRITQVNY